MSFEKLLLPIILLLILLIASYVGAKSHRQLKHKRFINASRRRLEILKKIESPEQQFGYLRKINPYIFEEMVLTALEQRGLKIIRNKSYSNDGGIDGAFILNNRKYLIQSKRYSNHINPKHVANFLSICKSRCVEGIFIHTGRTGPASKSSSSDRIHIISGSSMLNLLTGKSITINGNILY
jgi:restriction system protein